MPLFSLSLKLGSDTYLCQDPLYRSESCRRRLKKTAPCGSPGMATQDRQACRRRYWCFSISCRSTWQSCPLYLLHLSNLSFMIGMQNRCCILELRTNQCFVCNFLSVPRCKGQIALKKTQCLSCLLKMKFQRCFDPNPSHLR